MTAEEVLELMPFARLLGIDFTRIEADLVEGTLPVRPELCTAGGVAHGGAIISLSDSLGGVGAFLNLDAESKATTTIESKTNLLGAAKSGETLIARATPVHRGRRLQVWKIDVAAGEDARPVALTVQTQMTL